MNQLSIDGRLGADPQVRVTKSGGVVTTFPLAHTVRKKSDSGGWEDDYTMWFEVTVWGEVSQDVTKGKLVEVQGKLGTSTYQDRTGTQRTSLRIGSAEVSLKNIPGAATLAPGIDLESAPF